MGKILRVNISELRVHVEEPAKEYQRLGGRCLTSTIIYNEVPPTCDPLGKTNKLVIALGVLSGTNSPNSGRLSIGFKSPLTGGIKESNVGGNSSFRIGRLGINAIVVEGLGDAEKLHILHVSKEGGKLNRLFEF